MRKRNLAYVSPFFLCRGEGAATRRLGVEAGSSQSLKIGIHLSIDESIKIGKSDLIDIDCIDQSVEVDDTLSKLWAR